MARHTQVGKLRQLTLEQTILRAHQETEKVVIGSRDDLDRGDHGKKSVPWTQTEVTTDERPGPSDSVSPTARSSDESGSDEFSEPDPNSSDEWLPSGSDMSSRASSPEAPERQDRDRVSRRGPTPDGSVEREGHESSRAAFHTPVGSGKKTGCAPRKAATPTPVGSAKKRGRASRKSDGMDSGWHSDGWQPKSFPFTASHGPRRAAAELESDLPADFLELFLTDELLQHIVDQTKLYATQYFQAHPDSLPHSRGSAWKPVSVPELKTFFGLSFLTGYVRKPNLELYWSVDEVDATPYFSRTMSRNRFQIIWRFLHFNDNTSQDAADKMYKVHPVLDYVVEKFKEMYQPGQHICIDEGMMQWRGRLSFRVYNPQKPVKYGIKSYILCDSATGGGGSFKTVSSCQRFEEKHSNIHVPYPDPSAYRLGCGERMNFTFQKEVVNNSSIQPVLNMTLASLQDMMNKPGEAERKFNEALQDGKICGITLTRVNSRPFPFCALSTSQVLIKSLEKRLPPEHLDIITDIDTTQCLSLFSF